MNAAKPTDILQDEATNGIAVRITVLDRLGKTTALR
jgi:hypothetical protein